MSSDPYDLKPEPPKPPPPPEPTPAAPAAPTPISFASAPMPSAPPGFIPPTPVILGPNDPDPDIKDAEDNRVTAILSYIVFILPLVFAPKSKFARYHANQGLVLFCCEVVWFVILLAVFIFEGMLGSVNSLQKIAEIFWWVRFCLIMPLLVLFAVGLVVLALSGIINAANGERKPLHVIGNIKLLK